MGGVGVVLLCRKVPPFPGRHHFVVPGPLLLIVPTQFQKKNRSKTNKQTQNHARVSRIQGLAPFFFFAHIFQKKNVNVFLALVACIGYFRPENRVPHQILFGFHPGHVRETCKN